MSETKTDPLLTKGHWLLLLIALLLGAALAWGIFLRGGRERAFYDGAQAYCTFYEQVIYQLPPGYSDSYCGREQERMIALDLYAAWNRYDRMLPIFFGMRP